MHPSAWSLVPFLIVIPLALLTRQVLPGLAAGLLVGSYMLQPQLLGGIDMALRSLLTELSIPDNLRLLLFLYLFGSFVGLVRVTGGVAGFAAWVEPRIRSVRAAFAVTWVSSLATFMAPDFRIITMAPIMQQVFRKWRVPVARVAYMIDLTSTPLIALVPIGTAFVGYMVGLLQTVGRHHGATLGGYQLLLASLPFNFFSIAMLLLGLFQSFFGRSASAAPGPQSARGPQSAHGSQPAHRPPSAHGPAVELPAFRRRLPGTLAGGSRRPAFAVVETGGELTPPRPLHQSRVSSSRWPSPPRATRHSGGEEQTAPDVIEQLSRIARPHVWNLLLPLTLLVVLTLALTWWSGHTKATTLWGALAQANAAQAMLQAVLITLCVMTIWYAATRQSITRVMAGFVGGGNEMMSVILLLGLVWSVSAVSTELGFTLWTERAIGSIVPPAFVAPVLFVFGCAISYIIGSSFGTWGMLMPLAFSLAASAHASLPLVVGAVFASGTFGGFASPLSDNTVAMATVTRLPVMAYAHRKLWPALAMAGASTVAYGVAGWLLPGASA